MKNSIFLGVSILLTVVSSANSPIGYKLSDDYSLAVNGVKAEVIRVPSPEVRIAEKDCHPYSYAPITSEKDIEIALSSSLYDLSKAVILPESKGVKGVWKDGQLSFRMSPPQTLVIEPNGRHGMLVIAVSKPEKNIPNPKDRRVKYFAPGVHRPEKIILKSDETLYLAPGAWVEGIVVGTGDNITVCGSGVLSGAPWPWRKGPIDQDTNINPIGHLLTFTGNNLNIRDITAFSSFGWTTVLNNVTNAVVENYKVVSGRCVNDDGIDISQCKDVTIRNTFIRTQDDCIAPKWAGENLVVSNCTFITDESNIVRIGYECNRGESFKNLLFKDIDVLHLSMSKRGPERYWSNCVMLLQAANEGTIEDVVFDDWRIREFGKGDVFFLAKTMSIKEAGRCFTHRGGWIRNVTVRNPSMPMTVTSDMLHSIEKDPEHTVRDVKLVVSPPTKLPLVPMPQKVRETGGSFTGNVHAVAKELVDTSLTQEGYKLSVRLDGIDIHASSAAGFFYARKTLDQIIVNKDGLQVCPCVEIEDAPAYPWRGVLVDDARHFFGKEAIKKMIVAMGRVKMNVLHWHLTDDQGWRIQLDKWPELIKWGASRAETPLWRHLRKGDGKIYGTYYYTKDDIREIIDCAKKNHVKIVPEIELPGHSRAAIAAYPYLSCLGDMLERRPDTTWGVKRELFCAGNDETIKFLESVLDEVCELFADSDTIHIGGDECPKVRWRECQKCQSRIKKLGLKGEEELQGWMTKHFTEYLSKKGRRAIGWDEILEGGIPKGTIVMSWRGIEGAQKAAEHGIETVVCPNKRVYLDKHQGLIDDPWCNGHKGAAITLPSIYSFDPAQGISADKRSLVLGSQALLWSEHIQTPEQLFWFGFPRIPALAEALWTADEKRDYSSFAERVVPLIKQLRASGVNAAQTPEGYPENQAIKPAPRTTRGWMARHEYILAEHPTWRSAPDVVLIGDSITHYWAGKNSIGEIDDAQTKAVWKETFRGLDVLNLGIAGDRTQSVLWRLDNNELKKARPKVIALMIGVNNSWSESPSARVNTPEETVQGIKTIINRLRTKFPRAEIIVSGLLPLSEPESKARKFVGKVNEMLSRLMFFDYDGKVRYVDWGDRFLAPDGTIPRALMYDLVHPSDAGYVILGRLLRPEIDAALKRYEERNK